MPFLHTVTRSLKSNILMPRRTFPKRLDSVRNERTMAEKIRPTVFWFDIGEVQDQARAGNIPKSC